MVARWKILRCRKISDIYTSMGEEQVGNTIKEDRKFSWHSYMPRQLKTAGYAIIASDRSTRIGGFSPTIEDEISFGITSYMRTTTSIYAYRNQLSLQYMQKCAYIAHLRNSSDHTIPRDRCPLSIQYRVKIFLRFPLQHVRQLAISTRKTPFVILPIESFRVSFYGSQR